MKITTFKEFQKKNEEKCKVCPIDEVHRGLHNERCGGLCYKASIHAEIENIWGKVRKENHERKL